MLARGIGSREFASEDTIVAREGDSGGSACPPTHDGEGPNPIVASIEHPPECDAMQVARISAQPLASGTCRQATDGITCPSGDAAESADRDSPSRQGALE